MADIKKTTTTTTETETKLSNQISSDVVNPKVETTKNSADGTKSGSSQPTPDIAKPAGSPASSSPSSDVNTPNTPAATAQSQPTQPSQPSNTPVSTAGGSGSGSNPVNDVGGTPSVKPNVQYPGEEANQQGEGENEQGQNPETENKDKKDEDEKKDSDEDKEKDKDKEDKDKKPDEKEGEKKPEGERPTDTTENPNKIKPGDSNEERANKIKNDKTGDPSKRNSFMDKAKNAKNQYGDLKNKYGAEGVKNATGKAAKDMAKKLAKQAAQYLVKLTGQAAAYVIGLIGWPVIIPCAIIVLVLVLIFAGLACTAAGGNFGKTSQVPSGKNDPNIKVLLTKSTTPAKSVSDTVIKGQMALNLTDADKKFIEDGKADKRLLELLKYLSDKNPQLTISSIISGFDDPNNKDPENIDNSTSNKASAHTDGLAADIKTVGFVYKVDRPSGSCQRMVASFCGPPGTPSYDFCFGIAQMLKIGNLAYESDKNSPDDATTPDANTSLDDTLDQVKFDAEKIVLQNVQQTITDSQGQYADFTGKLTQSNDILISFRSKNLSKLSSDQRNQLNTKIDNIQNAINQVNDISNQINDYKNQINDYQTKIDSLQKNLKKVKSNLAKVQKFNNALGDNKDAGLDSMINNVASITNQVVSNLDTVDNQLGSINTVLINTTSTIASQIQGAQSIVGQNQGDINSYLTNLGSLNITVDAGNIPIMFTAFSSGKQALDGFIQKIEQLATSFIDKTVEQMVNEIKTTIKDQVQQVIDDQVNQTLSELGLSGFDKNTLLLLPCVGYVVPGTTDISSAIGANGAISDFTNSKLVDNINSGINSAVDTVNTANDQLSQVSQSISGVQDTITSFTSQVTQLENDANQFAKNAGDTYLVQVSQTVTKVQSTSNQEMDSLLKVPAPKPAGDQVCKSDSSSRDPNCTANIQDQQESQQQTKTQNQTNNQQNKDNLAKVKTRLETVKTTLQKTLDKQGNKLSQSQQAQVQQQIQAIQKTIGRVDIWVAKIDAYKTQMDEVNSRISNAQKTLTSVSKTLVGVQNFVNDISGSIGGWVTKLIPSGFRAYGVLPNTTYKDQPYTEAVQIQAKWQDDPPDSKYTNGEADNKGILNSLIFYTVYRPEAQRKVHNLIAELLQFPYDMKNKTEYRVTQLITFSKDRDVTPFKALVDKLYGTSRPANYGLFNMPESWDHLHIAY